MNRIQLMIVCACLPVAANADCLDESSVRSLDSGFDVALAHGTLSYFETVLHPDFVWVHDHASMAQRSRAEVIAFLGLSNASERKSSNQVREQRHVEVLVAGDNAVVTGFTDVTRNGQNLTFHFMRTYARIDGACLLLANHTMAIPHDDAL